MPNRLTESEVREISLVDRPAEPNAMVSFFKRDDDDDVEKQQPTSGGVHTDTAMKGSGRGKKLMDALARRLGLTATDDDDDDEDSEAAMEKAIDAAIISEAARLTD